MRNKILALSAVALVMVVAAGASVWYFVLRDDAPAEVTLAEALNSLASPTAGSGAAAASAAPTQAAAAPASQQGVNGTWTPDAGKGSFLGYRVGEQLVRVGTTTAVGRTSGVTGEVVVAGEKVTAAKIVGDMTQLKSDSGMRDGQLRNQGIETSKFPTATFELTEAVALPAGFATGQTLDTSLKGKLTLHGVTKEVSVPVQGKLQEGYLVVVGSIPIQFADYQINKPNGASVVSIDDHGVMELQLFLKRA